MQRLRLPQREAAAAWWSSVLPRGHQQLGLQIQAHGPRPTDQCRLTVQRMYKRQLRNAPPRLRSNVGFTAVSSRFVGCVAVRSDHLCGVWQFSERNEPRLLQVIGTSDIATCVSTRQVAITVMGGGSVPPAAVSDILSAHVCACVRSPHILGEVLVASESGVTNLWTVGRG